MKLKRIIIYPADIQRITGRSERYSREILKKIKEQKKKHSHQLVTVREFAEYAGLSLEEVEAFID